MCSRYATHTHTCIHIHIHTHTHTYIHTHTYTHTRTHMHTHTHTHTNTHTNTHTHTHTHTHVVLVLVNTTIRSRVLNEEATTRRDKSADGVFDHPLCESRLHSQTENWNDHWLLDTQLLRHTYATGNFALTNNTGHT